MIALGPEGEAHYEMLCRGEASASAPELTELREALRRAATAPSLDPSGALVATAVLLADALEREAADENWHAIWEAIVPVARKAPGPVRAAVMNGFLQAMYADLLPDDIEPANADCITTPADTLVDRLVPLAKRLTPNERRSIAAADYGTDVDRHLNALETVLSRSDCRIVCGEYYYPLEVIELSGHSPDAVGFNGATALSLIHWLPTDSDGGLASSRWHHNARAYLALPDPWRQPILDAFRHRYETSEDFVTIAADQLGAPPTIPWHRG
ncbi:MAG: hypothetical protein AAF933_16115 [Pseudomonadota bacterium]